MGIPRRFWKGNRYLLRVSHSLDEGRAERRQAFLFYQ